jgi:hypothetical protein
VAKEPVKLDGAAEGRTVVTAAAAAAKRTAKELVKCRPAVNLALAGRLGS